MTTHDNSQRCPALLIPPGAGIDSEPVQCTRTRGPYSLGAGDHRRSTSTEGVRLIHQNGEWMWHGSSGVATEVIDLSSKLPIPPTVDNYTEAVNVLAIMRAANACTWARPEVMAVYAQVAATLALVDELRAGKASVPDGPIRAKIAEMLAEAKRPEPAGLRHISIGDPHGPETWCGTQSGARVRRIDADCRECIATHDLDGSTPE